MGSQTPYTDTRERPRKKYVNWRYRSGGKPPQVTHRSKSASQLREKYPPNPGDNFSPTSNNFSGLFDSTLSQNDLKLIQSFSGNPAESSLVLHPENRKDQNSCRLGNYDVISMPARDHRITSSQSMLHHNYTVHTKGQPNDPVMTRSLTLAEGMRDANSTQEWAKLENQTEDLTSINYQMKLAQEKLDELRIEEAELIRRFESKLDSQTTLPKWYELKNADFCIQARKNNKMIKREQKKDRQNAMALSLDF